MLSKRVWVFLVIMVVAGSVLALSLPAGGAPIHIEKTAPINFDGEQFQAAFSERVVITTTPAPAETKNWESAFSIFVVVLAIIILGFGTFFRIFNPRGGPRRRK